MAVFVPLEDRKSWGHVARYLRTQGFSGTENDVIYEWLETRTGRTHPYSYNDLWREYFTLLGIGPGIGDGWYEWSNNAIDIGSGLSSFTNGFSIGFK
jgi:hypothetical protein